MIRQHQNLAAGRWRKLALFEQMANIGTEVERALHWQAKENTAYSEQAFERALELMDLTLEGVQGFPRLRELARLREAWVDYFFGTNQFLSTAASWRKYFSPFTFALRRNH